MRKLKKGIVYLLLPSLWSPSYTRCYGCFFTP